MMLKTVEVLISTYNGEKYIRDQIESVLDQVNVRVHITLRDDGSKDNTVNIIKKYYQNSGNLRIIEGKNVGVIESFYDLLFCSEEKDYYAFCDQDDVWDTDKLISAVNKISDCSNKPAMYFSSKRIVDDNLNIINENDDYNGRKKTLLELFVGGNNCTGCTIVINKSYRDLLLRIIPTNIVMHDYWFNILITAIKGNIYYDNIPHISYRQHENNVIGKKMTVKKRIKYSGYIKANCRSGMATQILNYYIDKLDNDTINLLKIISNYKHEKNGKMKLYHLLCLNCTLKKRIIIFTQIVFGIY